MSSAKAAQDGYPCAAKLLIPKEKQVEPERG